MTMTNPFSLSARLNGFPESVLIGSPFPGHIGKFPIRSDFRDLAIDILLFGQGNPAIIIGAISATHWGMDHQSFLQVFDYRVGLLLGR